MRLTELSRKRGRALALPRRADKGEITGGTAPEKASVTA